MRTLACQSGYDQMGNSAGTQGRRTERFDEWFYLIVDIIPQSATLRAVEIECALLIGISDGFQRFLQSYTLWRRMAAVSPPQRSDAMRMTCAGVRRPGAVAGTAKRPENICFPAFS